MKIVIIGAGASGIVAAINYKRNHRKDDVLVIEHLEAPLKKLLATGNGKCNLANSNLDVSKYSNSNDIKNILLEYNYEEFFKSLGLKTRNIGELVYPYSESAVTVKNVLLNEVDKLGIKINVSEKLIDYKVENKIQVKTDKAMYEADRLYLAASLCSSPQLGSDGSILSILKNHNYKIENPLPGLCPIKTKEDTKILDGIRTKCEVSIVKNNRKLFDEKGEVLFKKDGLSGIVIFNASSVVAREKTKVDKIVLDLLPDISQKEIENCCKSQTINGFLQGFFNPKIISYLMKRFPKESELISSIKHLEFTFKDFYGFEFSQVSVGGVQLSCVNQNLESKHEKGVYLIGELLDVDGPCGGYNLTWAFASAMLATK